MKNGISFRRFGWWLLALAGMAVLSGSDAITCVPVTPEEPVCAVPVDCAGLPHVNCAGGWQCLEGSCVWECGSGPVYTLHEWGVFKTGGIGADVSTTPSPYMGPVPAKPILYFYSDEEFSLDVGVHFASGEATEVWPEILMGQDIAWNGVEVHNGKCDATPFPEASWDSDPGVVPEVTQLGPLVVDEASCLEHDDTVAKLLFYTGKLPEWEAPLTIDYQIDDQGQTLTAVLYNSGDQDVEHVMVVLRLVDDECIDPSGCWIHQAALANVVVDSVPAGGEAAVSVELSQVYALDDEFGGALALPPGWTGQADQLEQKLLDMGLNQAEADAFMTAWTSIFFGVQSSASTFFEPEYSNGLFLIYPLSQQTYDQQLELTLSHPPEELVRVGFVYQKVDTQACMPAQEMTEGQCQCPEVDFNCSPWCWEGDPACTPGTWNDLTCMCDPAPPNQ